MARISAALAARQSLPAPQTAAEFQSPEQAIGHPTVETAEHGPPRPAQRLFKTATGRMKFPTKLKEPFLRPKKRLFNDDVHLEAYKPDALYFADKQRMGVHEAFDGCYSTNEHVERAVAQPFPLASEIPIPRETMKAARFVAENGPPLIADFWGAQLNAPETLVQSDAPSHARWNGLIDPSIRPAAG